MRGRDIEIDQAQDVGRDGPSCPGGDGGRMDLDTWTFAFSSPLSPTGILSLYIRYKDLVAGKTDTPFFFFFFFFLSWRGLMESRFN